MYLGIFVDIEDTVYGADQKNDLLHVWLEGQSNPTIMRSSNVSNPLSVFMTTPNDIYIDNGGNGRVDKWSMGSTVSTAVLSVESSCNGLFVDLANNIYCSMALHHHVIKMSLSDGTTTPTIHAGTGVPGSASNMLNGPHGIFVHTNFDLYVADFNNNRIQLYQSGQSNGITVAGNGAPGSITLNHPTSVILDADRYLFIVDSDNHRIVGSNQAGFRCLVGCSGGAGSASNQLHLPVTAAFDSYGNIYVTDYINRRIQKFILRENSCGEFT
jgi:hypothetical protein